MADFLAEYQPYKVEITLYGYTQETYESVTGVPGSHARCYRGIDLLLERGIKLSLKSVVLTLNQHEIQHIKGFSESLGLRFRYDPMINSGLKGDRTPLNYRLSPDDIIQLELKDHKRVENTRSFYYQQKELLQKNTVSSKNGKYLYGCGAGYASYHIDPYGKMSVCFTARHPTYDLRNGSFKQAWEEFIPAIRAQKVDNDNICSSCELRILCAQCPGWSLIEHKDPQAHVDFLCELAHKQAKAFGIHC
jgi:radical SAM protein with 4Fe4S-binding SPASM domain